MPLYAARRNRDDGRLETTTLRSDSAMVTEREPVEVGPPAVDPRHELAEQAAHRTFGDTHLVACSDELAPRDVLLITPRDG